MWGLCSDIDEIIHHVLSKYRKRTEKEYKTKPDWVEKVIYWELCKKLKFDHTDMCISTNLKLSGRRKHTKFKKKTRFLRIAAQKEKERHKD